MKIMDNKINVNIKIVFTVVFILFTASSCKKFFEPTQTLVIAAEDYFENMEEVQSAVFGLYALQQEVVDQLLVLGEVRGDLVTVTDNAPGDLKEINNFEISQGNDYISPFNLYKLIAACNNLMRVFELKYPSVLDDVKDVYEKYDELYGEVVTMRAWAYLNAARIYGEIPYIPSTLTSIQEIREFVESDGQPYYDSIDILYNPTDTGKVIVEIFNSDSTGYFVGSYGDTIYYNQPKVYNTGYRNMYDVIDSCITSLNKSVLRGNTYVVGYDFENPNNNDYADWELSRWNKYGAMALLGQLYLEKGDLATARTYFIKVIENNDVEDRYTLDNTIVQDNWKTLFNGALNDDEHIMVVKFNRANGQSNNFRALFSNQLPNNYYLKPTANCVKLWDEEWYGRSIFHGASDDEMVEGRLERRGTPFDFYRGYGVSYSFIKDGKIIEPITIRAELIPARISGDILGISDFMEGIDTVVYKYDLVNEDRPYVNDAPFVVYRAGQLALHVAETYTYTGSKQNGFDKYVSGSQASLSGVRGRVSKRVGFNYYFEELKIANSKFEIFDKVTGDIVDSDPLDGEEFVSYYEVKEDSKIQERMDSLILDERSRELAFEGERFYDLARMARNRNKPEILINRIASKFKGTAKEQEIRRYLADEKNWFIPFELGE
ncbi:RagB/SusD family nutrient uptake outer membrane protein [Bacteroidales bacterium]|nr:RagB/SusD family nutrient uptake outer membrane protein [Bacteroidales bacterium]